jgi:hypothetical protein
MDSIRANSRGASCVSLSAPTDDFREHTRMSFKQMQAIDPVVDLTEFRIRNKRADKYSKHSWREDSKTNEFVMGRKGPGPNSFK